MVKTLLKISEQTSWQIIGKAVSSLSTIFILGIVTRTYGEDGTGIFTLALTLLGLFYLAADFGINAHILPEFMKETSVNFQKLFGLRMIWSVVLMIMAGGLVLVWPDDNPLFKRSILIGLLAIFFSATYTTTLTVFQSRLKYNLATLSSILGTATTLLIIYWISLNNFPLENLMWGHLLGWLVIAFTSLLLVKSFVQIIPKFDFSFIKTVFYQSWPISLTIILNLVYFRLDAFLLTFYRSFAEVGIYNLAYQIFQSALVIPAFIMNSFYPVMLAHFTADKRKFINLFKRALLLMAGLAILGTSLTLLISPWLIGLITADSGFAGSAQSLKILSLSFPAFFITSTLMWLMILLKKYQTMLIIYLSGLIINVLLNALFIPAFSFMACSWITVFSEYLILTLQLIILVPVLNKIKHS